jgi:TetR/AcrR family transcriptional regulator, mexJK operon transcriptional repressor
VISEKKQRGRPKDDSKKTAILDSARNLFLEKGPDVTLDEIAAASGVAKATLYAKFTDKKGLIEAVIRRESDLTVTEDQFIKLGQTPVAEALYEFGLQYLSFINNRDLLNWDRLISALESQNSDLPKRFFDLGPGRGQNLLTKLIEQAVIKRQLPPCDPAQAADTLTGLWLGFVNLEIKLGVRLPLTDIEMKQRVERGVKNFLKILEP